MPQLTKCAVHHAFGENIDAMCAWPLCLSRLSRHEVGIELLFCLAF